MRHHDLRQSLGATLHSLERTGQAKLVFGSSGFRTDGSSLFVPGSPTTSDPSWVAIAHASVTHERGHLLYTDFSVPRKYPCRFRQGLVHGLSHGFEDVRIEYLLGEHLPGTKRILERGDELCHREKPQEFLTPHGYMGDQIRLLGVYLILELTAKWMPHRRIMASKLPAFREYMARELGRDLLDRIVHVALGYDMRTMGTWEAYEFAEKILDLLQSQSGDSDSEDEGETGGSGQSAGNQFAQDLLGQEVPDGDFTQGPIRDQDVPQTGEREASSGGGFSPSTGIPQMEEFTKTAPIPDLGAGVHRLSDELREILIARTECLDRHDQEEGLLDEDEAYRALMGDRHVFFEEDIVGDQGRVLVGILLDMSSSMSYANTALQAHAACMVLEALDGMDDVDAFVVGMRASWRSITHEVYFQPGDRLEDGLRKIAAAQPDGCTPLANSTLYMAYDMLAMEDQYDAFVLIVLTDGEVPPAYRETFAHIEATEGFHLFGIGMNADLSALFANHSRVDNPEEIPVKVADLLRSYFSREEL